jgi:hypothetical protein
MMIAGRVGREGSDLLVSPPARHRSGNAKSEDVMVRVNRDKGLPLISGTQEQTLARFVNDVYTI